MSSRVPRASTLVGAFTLLVAALLSRAADQGADPPAAGPPVFEWENAVRKDIKKDKKLDALVTKYPLVLLVSRAQFGGGGYQGSAFSFVHETSDDTKHGNNVQLLFDNGNPKTFDFNMIRGQQNLVADLGKVDFEKNPDLAKISIDLPGVFSGNEVEAVPGHVYLERIRDDRGQNFYVLCQVIAVDKDSRYMAFIWRKLPGGKVVKD
jgi:hypothetical protein